MTRKEFVRICSILGVSSAMPVSSVLSSCRTENTPAFKGKVIVIGAGAGGLSAAYLLNQLGIDFEILEASANYGGRMKINRTFADFPIPLGAEWLETDTGIFQEIVNAPSVQVNIQTVADDPDRKFINYSWFQFFEDYIVPSVANKITYSCPVNSINYAADKIQISTPTGNYVADKVIACVPLKILQQGFIQFNPTLPTYKADAIQNTVVWDGFKAFFEFSTKFYSNELEFPVTPVTNGQKIYYDAAFGQNTAKHILGLFTVGTPAQAYASLSNADLKQFVLNELDGIYNGQATPNYINHISQNWNNEPFIQAGYLSDHAASQTVQDLGKSVADKIYFAGAEFTDGEDWVSVHTAAQSAKTAVKKITT